jgi:hypothetical protein
MIQKFEQFNHKTPSDHLKYHLDMRIGILENIFRPGSSSFYNLLTESRDYAELLSPGDRSLFEETDLGLWDEFEGVRVPLDLPIPEEEPITEAEHNGKKVNLNKPMRSSGPKKYKVYVRNPKTGKVQVVHFGDVKGGLTAKVSDPKARKAFVQRHRCDRVWKPIHKLSAGYWSCHLPRYKHLFSGSKVSARYW